MTKALLPDWQTMLLVAYVLAIVALAWVEARHPASATAPNRERRWPTNFGIGLINIVLATLAPVSAVIAATWAYRNGYGLLNVASAPWWIAAAVTVLARSLVGYLLHVAMHKVPLFWRIHRVHHLDTHLDVSTSLRSHPLEQVMLVGVVVPAAALLGMNPVVLIVYEIAEAAIAAAAHANVRLPERLDRALRWVFVTPNMHCVHHSSYHRETDSNYSTALSVWDRLFGTYTVAPRAGYEAMQIGLKEVRDERTHDFVWQLKSPALDLGPPPKPE